MQTFVADTIKDHAAIMLYFKNKKLVTNVFGFF